jgi:hypothetical protein
VSKRAELRALTVGAPKQFKTKLVQVGDAQFEVRQPSIKSRSDIFKAAKAWGGDKDKLDVAVLQVEAVIRCTFEPGSTTLVFEEADRQSLLEQPSGSFVDELSAAALAMLNVDEEDLRKN